MRRALTLLGLVAALVGATQVAGASASTKTTWIYFHVHVNAYAHWGNCGNPGDHWQTVGGCTGSMEAGKFGTIVNYSAYHSNTVHWYWSEATKDVRKFTLVMEPSVFLHLKGTMPYNWHTLTVTSLLVTGREYATGTVEGAEKGHPGGPLYVDLSSHKYVYGTDPRWGYSLDLHGYVHDISRAG